MLKKTIKKAMMACVVGGILSVGIGGMIPAQVIASPHTTIDYGEYRDGKFHHWWSVDIGSIAHINDETQVHVSLENEHYCEETRIYRFKYNKDHWIYTHDTWTGKGAFNKGIFWNRVSSSKLANDVLYIVLNY